MKVLKLEKLKVKSFVTKVQQHDIKGGSVPSRSGCCSVPPGCPDPFTQTPTTSGNQQK